MYIWSCPATEGSTEFIFRFLLFLCCDVRPKGAPNLFFVLKRSFFYWLVLYPGYPSFVSFCIYFACNRSEHRMSFSSLLFFCFKGIPFIYLNWKRDVLRGFIVFLFSVRPSVRPSVRLSVRLTVIAAKNVRPIPNPRNMYVCVFVSFGFW